MLHRTLDLELIVLLGKEQVEAGHGWRAWYAEERRWKLKDIVPQNTRNIAGVD